MYNSTCIHKVDMFLSQFLDAFQNTQMFNVFIQERDTPSIYSTIANGNIIVHTYRVVGLPHSMCVCLGYFEKHLTRLKERSKDIAS